MSTAFGFPVIMPKNAAGSGIDRPSVIGRGGVQGSVRLDDGAADADGRCGGEQAAGDHRFSGLTADNLRRAGWRKHAASARIQSTGHPGRPSQSEVFDVVARDLRQCAVASPGVVAGIRGPRVRKRRRRRGRSTGDRQRGKQADARMHQVLDIHFRAAKYAVTS